jgi:hypothetical protein
VLTAIAPINIHANISSQAQDFDGIKPRRLLLLPLLPEAIIGFVLLEDRWLHAT